ncbi:hypothetical protein [Bradyrhizobium sp. STM 3843]|uniref:hypothetical protein n=1 Tax=Bradyrhizobium sp. STM 3843 TaxID=551947 RepID=UPI001111E03E|nr:hypothetical protein [Bradyrhizobium sp. STM 3843]
MTANNSPHAVLLFDERAETVLPYSSNAFNVSTGLKERVRQRYLGVMVLDRDGTVCRIEEILFEHLWGASIWRRMFSFINGGTRQISVTMSQLVGMGFNEMRQHAVEYVRKHPELIEQYFDKASPEEALSQAASSSTYPELFDALGVPEPLNCLDSLSAGR